SVPLKILFDIEKGEEKFIKEIEDKKILSVDKFSAYKVLKKMGLVELGYFWAHQRREFINLKTKYPEIPMDNNKAERMLRKVVLGRKNFYGY
ncbi:MAG: IS66 family transposase, partial [Candidatus Ratteibacteria bacterium]